MKDFDVTVGVAIVFAKARGSIQDVVWNVISEIVRAILREKEVIGDGMPIESDRVTRSFSHHFQSTPICVTFRRVTFKE